MNLYPRLISTFTAMQGRVGPYPSMRYSMTQVVHQTQNDVEALAPHPPIEVIQQDKNIRVNQALENLAGHLVYSENSQPGAVLHMMTEIGEWIGERILPRNCFCCLNGNVPKTVEILTDQHEIPWELTRINGGFLSELAVHARYPFVTRTRHAAVEYSKSPKMAIVLGLTEGLELAQKEADDISSLFRQRFGTYPDRFESKVGGAQVLREILLGTSYGSFDLVHFIGHGSSQIDSVWLEFPGLPFLGADVPRRLGGNPLVFWNACHSSASISQRFRYQSDIVDAFGGRLLSAGASHFIGSLFPVLDSTATQFSVSFYSSLFSGHEVGLAFFAAKKAVASADPLVHTYALYGNPLLRVFSDV